MIEPLLTNDNVCDHHWVYFQTSGGSFLRVCEVCRKVQQIDLPQPTESFDIN